MGNVQTKPKEILGIEKLMSNIENISNETKRIPREIVTGIFNQILNEIPYASQVIPITLGDNLYSYAPQKPTQLELNETIVFVAKAIFDPNQKNAIAALIQTYRHDRKKSEREYAAALLEEVLKETNLLTFPAPSQPALMELAKTIIEKIINEKHLRKQTGYRLQPIIEIVESFIYQRSPNIEIERAKVLQALLFKKFVNSAAQAAYEKIVDDKLLAIIQKEKIMAFSAFKIAIAGKISQPAALRKYQANMQYLQNDYQLKSATLKKQFDEILKPVLIKRKIAGYSQELLIRFHEKLRKELRNSDLDPEIYATEELIKKTHDETFIFILEDLNSTQNLIDTTFTIAENFNKKLLQSFTQKDTLQQIQSALIGSLLGKVVTKIDPITAQTKKTWSGGYPVKNLSESYKQMIEALINLNDKASGFFVNELKAEISKAIEALKSLSQDLRTITRAPIIKRPVEMPMLTQAQSEIMLQALVEAESKSKAISEETTDETQKASLLDEQFDIEPEATEKAKPLQIEEPVKEEPIQLESVEKTEPQPLPIEEPVEEEPIQLESVEKTEPQPLQIEEPIEEEPIQLEPVEKTEPQPLQIEEPVEEEPIQLESVEKTEPQPLHIEEPVEEEPIQLEPIAKTQAEPPQTPAEEEPLQLEPVAKTESVASDSNQAAIDTGINIMKNYQLGSFESHILESWKFMVNTENTDNEVRLYVICDLAQQVSALPYEALPPEQQQALDKIKTQIIEALKNPLDENNWDYFEGTQRDYIDGTLMALSS